MILVGCLDLLLMSQIKTETDDRCAVEAAALPVAILERRLRRAVAFAVIPCAAAIVLLTVGFPWFVSLLPAEETELHRNADGIVVLTGGASRISDAIELLAAGRGRRLLISRANRATTSG